MEVPYLRMDPAGGTFIWADSSAPESWHTYRRSISDDQTRKIEEIPSEEIKAAFSVSSGLDLPSEVARLFGIRRLTSGIKERLEAVAKLMAASP